jgi:hypothetical protein
VRRPGWDESRSPLLHPAAVAALVLLVVNDHLLKAAWPGLVSGKASDIAALLLVPPLAVEIARLLARGHLPRHARSRIATAAAIAIAASFVAVKLHPVANEAYAIVLGWAQWPGAVIAGLVAGTQVPLPGSAPTVLDAGDLIALPAAAVGRWIAAGGRWQTPTWRPGAGSYAAARIGMLIAALFALAATSPARYSQVTVTAPDEVLFDPGDTTVERRATVAIRDADNSGVGSIAIEARSRWPLVEPAPRFVITREGAPTSASGSAQLWVDPETCPIDCRVPIVISITWTGSGDQMPTSVAWEVAATAFAEQGGGFFSGSSVLQISSDGFAARWHGLAPWVSVPLALVIAVLILAATGRIAPVERRGITTAAEGVVLIASVALAGILIVGPLVASPSVLEPAAGYASGLLRAASLAAGLAIAVATGLWLRGSGALLATAIVVTSVIGLPFAARLIGEASATFAGRGLALVGGVSVVAAISLAGALMRPGRIGDVAWVPPSRVFVAAVGIATATALFIASALDRGASGIAASLALAHVVAVILWWGGGGRLLGLTSLAIGGGTILRGLMGGPNLFGPGWTSWDLTMILGVCLGAGVTLVAAFGGIGRHPVRRSGSDDATRIAVDQAIADRAAEPPTG